MKQCVQISENRVSGFTKKAFENVTEDRVEKRLSYFVRRLCIADQVKNLLEKKDDENEWNRVEIFGMQIQASIKNYLENRNHTILHTFSHDFINNILGGIQLIKQLRDMEGKECKELLDSTIKERGEVALVFDKMYGGKVRTSKDLYSIIETLVKARQVRFYQEFNLETVPLSEDLATELSRCFHEIFINYRKYGKSGIFIIRRKDNGYIEFTLSNIKKQIDEPYYSSKQGVSNIQNGIKHLGGFIHITQDITSYQICISIPGNL